MSAVVVPICTRAPTPVPSLDYRRVYRAHVEPLRGECERTVFVEAFTHEQAVKKITAALEACWPHERCVNERVYNVHSAAECIDQGESEDVELRLFEVSWGGGRAPGMCRDPLFLVDNPGAWATKWAAAHREGSAA